jgi:hypothetical protein
VVEGKGGISPVKIATKTRFGEVLSRVQEVVEAKLSALGWTREET